MGVPLLVPPLLPSRSGISKRVEWSKGLHVTPNVSHWRGHRMDRRFVLSRKGTTGPSLCIHMIFPPAQHYPPAHSGQETIHTSGHTTDLSGSWRRCGTGMIIVLSTSLRSDLLSPKSNLLFYRASGALPCPFPQPPIVFPFLVALTFASWTFKTRSPCWIPHPDSVPTASLLMEVSLQLLRRIVYASGRTTPVVTPC